MTKYKIYSLKTNKKVGNVIYDGGGSGTNGRLSLAIGNERDRKELYELIKVFLKKKGFIFVSDYQFKRSHSNHFKRHQKNQQFEIYTKKINLRTRRIDFEKEGSETDINMKK